MPIEMPALFVIWKHLQSWSWVNCSFWWGHILRTHSALLTASLRNTLFFCFSFLFLALKNSSPILYGKCSRVCYLWEYVLSHHFLSHHFKENIVYLEAPNYKPFQAFPLSFIKDMIMCPLTFLFFFFFTKYPGPWYYLNFCNFFPLC